MRVLDQFRTYSRVLPLARRNRLDLVRWLRRRPAVFLGNFAYEMGLLFSARVPGKLKALAELKAATLIHCEFCLDIGSALGRAEGVTEAQVRSLARFRESDEFTDTEKLVLSFAEAITATPAELPEKLRRQLHAKFSKTQLAELAATISWENQRARFNQALGVRPAGFSDDGVCALPEHRPAS